MSKPIQMPPDVCDACRFYRRAEIAAPQSVQDVRGTCRRFPASIGKMPGEWCGEFRRKGA